ncbi:MAG: nodulation protein NfeD [Spirochaetia bacterium]|nr:nodulation protein NfeD [Spirochaetia bacterium]
MKRTLFSFLIIISIFTPLFAAAPVVNPVYYRLNIEGIIDAATSDYVMKGIELAEKDGAAGVIITMQTPGGLEKSMRKISDRILNASVPVITYVSPKGARAASAGVFILLSSHVAAMAEGTNIGAAHPVDYDGKTASDKITNDAAAYIKNLARLHNRNEKWAEEAVRKSVSISEVEALNGKVIDVTAADINDLMAKLDGKKVKVGDKDVVLNTKNFASKDINPTAKHQFLHMLADPNIVYILFLIGIYGLIYELANGFSSLAPGIAGAIAVVLAFTGFDSLPINTAGIILVALSAVLFFVELITPTNGLLWIGGIICMGVGSFLMFPGREHGNAWHANYFLMAVMILLTVAFFALVVGLVIKAHKKKSIMGQQSLIGLKGTAISDVNADAGVVNIGGEEWQAWSDDPVKAREIVEVLEVNGMKLKVKYIPRKKEE